MYALMNKYVYMYRCMLVLRTYIWMYESTYINFVVPSTYGV